LRNSLRSNNAMGASEQREAAGTPKPQPTTVGQVLREARAAQDLSLEQLAAELRIEPQQLDALEQNRFERIGVPVFVKGYIRQYGQRLGLNQADLLSIYYEQGKLEDIDIRPSRTIKLRDEQQTAVWVVAFILLAAIVGGLAYWWLNGAPGFAPAVAPPVETPAPQPSLSSQGSPALTAADRNEAPAAVESAAVPVAPAVPVMAAAPQPDAAAESAGAAEALAGAGAASDAESLAPRAAADELFAELDITFEQESWAEITDVRGTRLLFDLGTAGRQSVLRGEPPFTVVLGNADGVRLKLNGQPYDIPRIGRQGNRASFTLDTAEE
jgi:cytoskeleton protein RodZ